MEKILNMMKQIKSNSGTGKTKVLSSLMLDLISYFWKLPLADNLQNRCSSKFRNINGKTPVFEPLFIKVAGNFIKARIHTAVML